MRKNGPVILTILDGWGHRVETAGNAIALARKPTYDKLLREYPNTLIRASDHFVGLPDGQMGNSEVGHLNLGAGRVVRMDISRIDEAIASGAFFEDVTLVKAMRHALEAGRALHLIGLVSDGGVHSQQRHLWARLKMAAGARRRISNAKAPMTRSTLVSHSQAMMRAYTFDHTRSFVIARWISALPGNVVSMLSTWRTN